MSDRFSIAARIRSFAHAFRGFGLMLRTQHNAWIHALATLVVVMAGIGFKVERRDWALLIFAMVGVWVAEALNTSIELVADAISSDHHTLIGKAKDVGAAAVLLAAAGATVIGLIVFTPYFQHLRH